MPTAYISRRAYIESLIASALLLAGAPAFGANKKTHGKAIIQGGYFRSPENFIPYKIYPKEAWTNRRVFRAELATRKLIGVESSRQSNGKNIRLR